MELKIKPERVAERVLSLLEKYTEAVVAGDYTRAKFYYDAIADLLKACE